MSIVRVRGTSVVTTAARAVFEQMPACSPLATLKGSRHVLATLKESRDVLATLKRSRYVPRAGVGVLVAALVLLPDAQGFARMDVLDRVLATVEGRVITLSDVRAAQALGLIAPEPGADPQAFILERLIDRVLVLQEVERYSPPEPDAAAIDRGVAAIRTRSGSDAALEATVRRFGLEPTFVRQWIRNDLRIALYLDQRFAGINEPTAEEIENYRRQHAGELQAAGAPANEASISAAARTRVMLERRDLLAREWIESLRARGQIGRPPATP
jgi:hypothetical protein